MVAKLIKYALQSSKQKNQIQSTTKSILGSKETLYVNKKIHSMVDTSNITPNDISRNLWIIAERTSKPEIVDKEEVKTCKVLLSIGQKQYMKYHAKFVGTLDVEFDRFKAAVVLFIFTFIMILVIAKKYNLKLKDAFNPMKLQSNYEYLAKQSKLIARLYVICYLAMVGSGFTILKEKLLGMKNHQIAR